jgi:hypothetical protein
MISLFLFHSSLFNWAIHTRYLAGIEHLHDFMQGEVMK